MSSCGRHLLAHEGGKDCWLKLGDPSDGVVSFHGHRAVFASRSPYLERVLNEPQNYYGAAVFFDAFGVARHAFDVLRYMYLGVGCLTMEAGALRAYRVIFERLEMREDLEATRGLLESLDEEELSSGAETVEETREAAEKPELATATHEEETRKVGPAILLTLFGHRVGKRRREVVAAAKRRSARLKKPRRSTRVRQLSVRV